MNMKKLLVSGFLIAGIGALSVWGDAILPGHHVVERCVKIENLRDYPDFVLIGVSVHPGGNRTEYIVNQDSCLSKGYKFNAFYLCWTTRDIYDSLGLDQLPVEEAVPDDAAESGDVSQSVFLLSSSIEPYGGMVPDSNDLVKEEITYALKSAENGLELEMVGRIELYEDGTTEEFGPSAAVSFPEGTKSMDRRHTLSPIVTNNYLMYTPSVSGMVQFRITDCRGRTVVSVSRTVKEGATYAHSFRDLSSGVYWVGLVGGVGQWHGMLRLTR